MTYRPLETERGRDANGKGQDSSLSGYGRSAPRTLLLHCRDQL